MTDLYLIAHKVRGEATFDVAHRLMIGDEEGWVLTTCGYRAHPWWSVPLVDIDDTFEFDPASPHFTPGPMPPDALDCFHCNRPHEAPPATSGRDLLKALGLLPVPEKVRRI